jgi:hypothetical protein
VCACVDLIYCLEEVNFLIHYTEDFNEVAAAVAQNLVQISNVSFSLDPFPTPACVWCGYVLRDPFQWLHNSPGVRSSQVGHQWFSPIIFTDHKVCARACVCMCVGVYVCVCMYVCIFVCMTMYVWMYVRIYVFLYARMYTCMNVRMNVCMYVYFKTLSATRNIYIYIYIYTHTHIHTYTRTIYCPTIKAHAFALLRCYATCTPCNIPADRRSQPRRGENLKFRPIKGKLTTKLRCLGQKRWWPKLGHIPQFPRGS